MRSTLHFRFIFDVLESIRAPVLVSVAACLVLALPQQSLEVYRALFQDWREDILKMALSLTSIVAVSAALWVCSWARLGPKAETPAIRALVAAVAAAPLLALALGLHLATPPSDIPDRRLLDTALSVTGALLAAATGLCTAILIWRGPPASITVERLFSTNAVLATTIALSLFTLAGLVFGPPLTLVLGPIGVFSVFFCFLLYYASYFSYVHDTKGIPVTLLLVLAATIFSIWNNNHAIRATISTEPTRPMKLEAGFIEWYKARADIGSYSTSRPYPVYIVTTEGGGIYAAYHSATALARIQESCPGFAQHLFAISSVSGGSLGAALFAGLTEKHAKNDAPTPCSAKAPGELSNSTKRFLETDFLTPLLWAWLFPDFTQRFLPAPINSLDRAIALERGFESAWSNLFKGEDRNFFVGSLRDAWSPAGSTPALVMNATETAWGTRELISPVVINSPLIGHSGYSLGAEIQLPVSSAVSISARFPYITPAALLDAREQGRDEVLQLVDGGYFDNSGIETAVTIISLLKRAKAGAIKVEKADEPSETYRLRGSPEVEALPPFKFILVSIRAKATASARSRFGEGLSPIVALINARSARGDLTVRNARATLCPACSAAEISPTDTVRSITLDPGTYRLPLGWMISAETAGFISSGFDNLRPCPGPLRASAPTQDQNACTIAWIHSELTAP